MALLLLIIILTLTASIVPVSGTTQASKPQVTQETKEGISLKIDPSDRPEHMSMMNNLTDRFPVTAKSHAFLFGSPNESYVVFTDQEPKDGRATVEGTVISDIWVDVNPDYQGVIFADEVSFTQEGERVRFDELKSKSDDYHYSIVEVEANLSQLAYLIDAGESQIKQSRVGGGLHQQPTEDSWIVPPGQAGRWTALNLSNRTLSLGHRSDFLNEAPTITIRDWSDQNFWVNDRAIVTGIFFKDSAGYGDQLFLVDISYSARNLDGPSEVVNNGDELEGEVVTLSADVVGAKSSTKKTLLEVARCAPDSIANPILGCMPIFTDTTLHSGAAFSGSPSSKEDVLVYAGLSNHPQDEALVQEAGRYRLTGRVVSTDKLDPRLPEGYGLVVYEMERTGDLSIESEKRTRVRGWSNEIRSNFVDQMNTSHSEWEPSGPNTVTPTATPSPTDTPSPTKGEANSGGGHSPSQTTSSPGQSGFGAMLALFALITLILVNRQMGV